MDHSCGHSPATLPDYLMETYRLMNIYTDTDMGGRRIVVPPISLIIMSLQRFSFESLGQSGKPAQKPLKIVFSDPCFKEHPVKFFSVAEAMRSSLCPIYAFATGELNPASLMLFVSSEKRFVTPETYIDFSIPKEASGEVSDFHLTTYRKVGAYIGSFCSKVKAEEFLNLCVKGEIMFGERIVDAGYADSCDPAAYKQALFEDSGSRQKNENEDIKHSRL